MLPVMQSLVEGSSYIIEKSWSIVTKEPITITMILRALNGIDARFRASALRNTPPMDESSTRIELALRLRNKLGRYPRKISTFCSADAVGFDENVYIHSPQISNAGTSAKIPRIDTVFFRSTWCVGSWSSIGDLDQVTQ